jgi:hypothetical protein
MTLILKQYFPTYYVYNQHNYRTVTVTFVCGCRCCSHLLILFNVMTQLRTYAQTS